MASNESLTLDFDFTTSAAEYYGTLPMEHFMESVGHATSAKRPSRRRPGEVVGRKRTATSRKGP